MRAIVITKPGLPDVLQVAEVEDPKPGPEEILVQVGAAGINRADILQRLGRYPPPPGVRSDIPGLEFAGTVIQCGNRVRQWTSGDRVMGLSPGAAYAERVAVPAGHVLRIPEAWSFSEAAAVPEAYATAYDAIVTQCGLKSGERLLVHAVGSGVGVASVAIGKAFGATVAGTSRSPWKLERAAAFGLDVAIHVESVFQPSADMTGWADVIMELVSGGYLPGDLVAAAPGARLIIVGLTGGRRADMDLGAILTKRLTIIGTTLRNRSDAAKDALLAVLARDVLPLFAANRITPALDRAFPMIEAAAAHRYVEENRNFGSVVLAW